MTLLRCPCGYTATIDDVQDAAGMMRGDVKFHCPGAKPNTPKP